MEDMTLDQLVVIENDVLFNRSQVTGDNVHHQLATYNHLIWRRNRFPSVVAGALNWVIEELFLKATLFGKTSDTSYL